MNISKALASRIVDAVYEVVKKDTNLINPSGIIIGSTDKKRIGTFHAAGAYAASHGVPVFVDTDHPFKGAKDGINYPIFLENNAIAVIGITGDPEELKPFGFLITKITEVFLKEQQLDQELLSETRALQYLITSLIHGSIRNQDQLEHLLEKYHINPDEEFAVLSVKLKDPSLEQSLRFYFKSVGCTLSAYLYPNEWVSVFDRSSFRSFHPKEFAQKYRGQIYAGLGDFGALYQAEHSYGNARIARKHAQNQNLEFCNIENISIEFILESIPSDIQKIYSDRILQSLTEKELRILRTYFSSNLSLKETSALLFIHKNTLQYQLDRITEKTGLNPRSFQDAFLIQLALLCKS